MEYKVFWEIDITADTPEDAAREARKMQLDPQAQVGHFTVSYTKALLVEVEVDLDALATTEAVLVKPAATEAALGKPDEQDVICLKDMSLKQLEEAFHFEVPGYPRIKWWASNTLLMYHEWVHAQVSKS